MKISCKEISFLSTLKFDLIVIHQLNDDKDMNEILAHSHDYARIYMMHCVKQKEKDRLRWYLSF